MRKHFFFILVFTFCFIINGLTQNYKKLEKADSLAKVGEYSASINLINGVLNTNPRNFLKAQAYYQLSDVYLQQYNLKKAYDFNKRSLTLRDLLHYEFIADNHMRFGAIELLQNNLEKALEYFLDAQDLPHQDLQFSGVLDTYLGDTYQRLGQPDLALEYFQNALEILEWELGEDHPDVSLAHFNLGNFYTTSGEFSKATSHLEKSIAIELKLRGDGDKANTRLAQAYNALGMIAYKDKLDTTRALSNFKQSLQYSKGHQRIAARSNLNIAQMLYLKKEGQKALKEIDIAFKHLYSGDATDPRYFIPLIIDKELYTKGLHLKTKIILEAITEDDDKRNLTRAFETSSLALRVYEARLLDFYKGENQFELIPQSMDIYEQSIYTALKLYGITSDAKYFLEALKSSERSKAAILKNQMHAFYDDFDKGLSFDINEEEERIQTQLAFFESDFAERYDEEKYRTETLNLHRDYKNLLKKIKQAGPQYYNLRHRFPKISIEEIQKNLNEDEVLLSYYMGKDFYYIFGISKEGTKAFMSDQNSFIQRDSSNAVLDFIAQSKMGDQFVDTNRTLYKKLIEPINDVIKDKKELIIVPHSDFHFLNFETFLKEQPKKKKKYKKYKYLIKDYAITYQSSIDFLLSQDKASTIVLNSIAAWAPVFDKTNDLAFAFNLEHLFLDTMSNDSSSLNLLASDHSTFRRLESTEQEMSSIVNLYTDKKYKGDKYQKGRSTEEVFKLEAAKYKHLHIASYSFVNPSNLGLSGIAFLPSDDEDGILYANEILNMSFRNTSLLVLRNGHTVGSLKKGEALSFLNNAFHFAGIDTVLSSRWEISDDVRSQMMAYFYEKMLSGAGYSKALQYAKLKMLKKNKTANPNLWAGFMLSGLN